MDRPDPRLVPLLLDRQSTGRDSLLAGLIRALVLLLTSGRGSTSEAVREQMNAVTRTAMISAQALTAATQDAIAGSVTPATALVSPEAWSASQVEALLRETDRGAASLLQQLEREADLILERATADVMVARSKGGPDSVVGYRRVIHPELSRGGTCGLCLVASDKIYRRPDLRAVHGRCKCTVMEVRRSYDPGGSLNNLELGGIYKAANLGRGQYGDRSALSNVRISRQSDGDLLVTKTRTATESAPEISAPASNPAAVANLFASISAAYAKQAG